MPELVALALRQLYPVNVIASQYRHVKFVAGGKLISARKYMNYGLLSLSFCCGIHHFVDRSLPVEENIISFCG
jgi:hypothetical protein